MSAFLPADAPGSGPVHWAGWPARVGFLIGALVVADTTAAPVPSAPPTVINVSAPSASAPSVGSLLVTVDGLAVRETNDAQLLLAPRDIQEASPVAKVAFGAPVALAPGSSQRRWMLPFQVTGLPAGTTQTRYVEFKLGAARWALPYQIASPTVPAVSWSLKPPPASNRALHSGDGIPISIAVNAGATLAGVTLMPLDLIEKSTGRPLANVQWRLCRTPTTCGKAEMPTSLDGGPHSFWIMPVDGASVPPGKYEGTVTIASADKPTGESVSVTLSFSSLRVQAYGFLVILSGLGLGFYVTTFLRRRVERDQLLLGPAVLRAESDRLRLALHADSLADTPHIDAKLAALQHALSESQLASAGLPPKIPMPWPVSTDGYRQHVDRQTEAFNSLRAIVETGIFPLLAARHDEEARDGPLDANETAAFAQSMRDIDAIAQWGTPPDPAAVSTMVAPHLRAFDAAIEKSRGPADARPNFTAGAAPSARFAKPRLAEQLRIRITEGSLLAWVLLGVVTATTGTYVLILSNPGFGTCLDIVGCLLWGAGLPAGAALAGSTTGTVSTALNITR